MLNPTKNINIHKKATYKVEIVTQYAVGSLLKEPRTASFDKILTVN